MVDASYLKHEVVVPGSSAARHTRLQDRNLDFAEPFLEVEEVFREGARLCTSRAVRAHVCNGNSTNSPAFRLESQAQSTQRTALPFHHQTEPLGKQWDWAATSHNRLGFLRTRFPILLPFPSQARATKRSCKTNIQETHTPPSHESVLPSSKFACFLLFFVLFFFPPNNNRELKKYLYERLSL